MTIAQLLTTHCHFCHFCGSLTCLDVAGIFVVVLIDLIIREFWASSTGYHSSNLLRLIY